MKNKKLQIRSNGDCYFIIDEDYYTYKKFNYYDQAVEYLKYYYGTDPIFESSESISRRQTAIKRSNRIDQILGE